MSETLKKLQSIHQQRRLAAAKNGGDTLSGFSLAASAASRPGGSSSSASNGTRPKTIAVMGSTGSIGLNTLRIVRAHPQRFRIRALAAKTNVEMLVQQAREFRPEMVCIFDDKKAAEAEKKLRRLKIKVVTGSQGLEAASSLPGVDQVLFAMVGAIGLAPLFAAVRARKSVAVANKEPLVMAGELLMKEARRLNVSVLPVDSEHSGLWQCLEGRDPASVKKLVLTSSGGPFRMRRKGLSKITVREALRHPKWKMGPKITIDSATLMNKGLEVIEAANLFGVACDKIEVLIHPEAIIHAVVEFVDGTHLAQLGVTDMRLPIQYALSYPHRLEGHAPELDLARHKAFHFEKPDLKRFPCLELGYEASRRGGSMPAVLNAANEIIAEAFLKGRLRFTDIPRKLVKVMKKHEIITSPSLEDLLGADHWARKEAEAIL